MGRVITVVAAVAAGIVAQAVASPRAAHDYVGYPARVTVPLRSFAAGLTVLDGRVWTTEHDDRLVAIEPRSDTVARRVRIKPMVDPLIGYDGLLWGIGGGCHTVGSGLCSTLVGLSPRSGRAVRTVAIQHRRAGRRERTPTSARAPAPARPTAG